MSIKKVSVANFNTVFLTNDDDDERPLLEYFDTILMPALNSGIIREINGDKYFFMDVHIIEDCPSNYVLTGLIIKKTILEIKSDIDENGQLIELDDKYPSAPFSIFAIYLKNHRMLYVENQKGSPRLGTFRSTVKYVIDRYVRDYNALIDNTATKLPIPLVNVIGIPPRKSIERELKDVIKIKKLTLKFYPLNGDGDVKYAGLYNSFIADCRKMLGSKTGETSYNSPKNVDGGKR